MTQIEAIQRELESEAVVTRKMLSLVPADKYDWAPHEKSMKMKSLAVHIAELPTWLGMALTTDELDFENNPYQQAEIANPEELMAYFEKCQLDARQHLDAGKEVDLEKIWTLRSGETVYSTGTKWDIMRISMSQVIHHRAQLGVYLRLLNIPIPGSYGPSADESF